MKALDFKQNNQNYLSLILSHEEIDENSEVLIYGNSPFGYQRDPVPAHYNKIKNYILDNKNFILPTSIVLAADEEDIKKMFDKSSKELIFKKLIGTKSKKIFRIVDGQHRIIAMREAIKTRPELRNFLFNVILLITKPNSRSVEMEIFYDINSKGKRLKVDLIELARFNYRILEKTFLEKELNEHIAIQTAYFLNEQFPKGVWSNAIKLGIHDDQIVGVIGVNAFRESIFGIVDAYLKIDDNNKYKKIDGEGLVEYSNKAAKNIAEFINEAWTEVVKQKWKFCFKEGEIELDLFLEPKTIFYNNKYYLQRTMGAKALNGILSSIVNGKEVDGIKGLNKSSMKRFKEIITHSKIYNDDWLVGGLFGGYSSESGFKKVSSFILNKDILSK